MTRLKPQPWRLLALMALASTAGCTLFSGEIPCESSYQCPDTIRLCDLEDINLDAGELGVCVPGTAPTGIPEPDEALIDVPDGGVVDGGVGFPFAGN